MKVQITEIIVGSDTFKMFNKQEITTINKALNSDLQTDVHSITLELYEDPLQYLFSVKKISENMYLSLLDIYQGDKEIDSIDRQTNDIEEALKSFVKVLNELGNPQEEQITRAQ